MPSVTFFPSRDTELLAWSVNFKTVLAAGPETVYGISSGQLTAYNALHTAFASALANCDPNIRNKSAVAIKNTARTSLKNDARLLANIVYGQASVSDGQKIELGLTVRSAPSPIPAPLLGPKLSIVSVVNRTVRVQIANDETEKRAKPPGVHGASLFSYVGSAAPIHEADWRFEGNTNLSFVDVEFDDTVAGGAQVWFIGFYYNPRSQSGPPSDAITTYLQGGPAIPLAA